MAGVDGGVVARINAEVACDITQQVVLSLAKTAIGCGNAKEEVHHVVTSGIVGVVLDLRTDSIHIDIGLGLYKVAEHHRSF